MMPIIEDDVLKNLRIVEPSKVCEDSGIQDLLLPPLNKSIVLRLTRGLRLDQIVSIVFLIVKPGQALGICRKLLDPKDVLSGEKVIEHLVEELGKSASKGAHSVLLGAFSLLAKLIPYLKELILETEKFSSSENLAEYVTPEGYKALKEVCQRQMDESRVKLFLVANELDPKEASEIVNRIKNKHPSFRVAAQADAKAWTPDPEVQMEIMILELLAEEKMEPSDLLKTIPTYIRDVSKLARDDLQTKFAGILEHEEGPKSFRKLTHGECLIINNKNFSRQSEVRHGSEVDGERLSRIFEDFNCEVSRSSDLTANKLREQLEAFQKKVNEKGRKSDEGFFTVLTIMSHGRQVQKNVDEIIGIDGKGVPVNDIVDMFTDLKMCPGLEGKVKVFIFQACRLEEPLDFAKPIDETSKVVKDTASVIVADGNERCTSLKSLSPNKSWRIEFRSTAAGEPSFRDPEKGAFFIRALCDVMTQQKSNPDPMDLVRIFTLANRQASETLNKASNGSQDQCGECTTTCLMDVFLPQIKDKSK